MHMLPFQLTSQIPLIDLQQYDYNFYYFCYNYDCHNSVFEGCNYILYIVVYSSSVRLIYHVHSHPKSFFGALASFFCPFLRLRFTMIIGED